MSYIITKDGLHGTLYLEVKDGMQMWRMNRKRATEIRSKIKATKTARSVAGTTVETGGKHEDRHLL